MAGEQLAAGSAGGDLGGPAQDGLALRPAGEGDDDALSGRPGCRDPVRGAVPLQRLVDAVGQPEQGQLAQGGEVAGPEVVRQRGVDAGRGVDVPVRHPPPQGLRRHVDQLDLVGRADDVVRDRLALDDPRDGLDDVVERLEVLDVDRRDDVDPGVEEDVDVLPPLRPRRAGGVRVRELVDEGDLGSPREDGVDVELGEARAPVLHGAAGDDREAVGLSRGEGPAVRLEDADDDVGAAVLASAALGEHGHGLPDAGGGAEVDAQSSAGHGPIVYLSGRRAVVSPPRRRGRG